MCLKYIDMYLYMYMIIYFHIHACSCIYIYKSDELARQVKYNPAEVTFKDLLSLSLSLSLSHTHASPPWLTLSHIQ